MVRRDTQRSAPEGEDDYEAQRQANIKANLELMMSLGLYQGSKLIRPASAPKPKPKVKAVSPAGEYEPTASTPRIERPRRITRSVSRTLDSPKKSRGIKRTLSDDAVSYVRKTARRAQDDLSSDDEYKPSSRRPSSTPLNPARHDRDSSDLQRHSDRLGVRIHDPKTFGAIPGIRIGTLWEKRIDCSTDAVHAPTVAGISGNESDGCWSICLSGGYEDDVDLGERFTYTGSGGRDLKGTANNPKNLRTAPQSSDQKWEGKNAALRRSVETRKPVRVVRGWKAANRYAPEEGYVYSGLYRVERAWMERGASGWMVCKFGFVRLPGQAALPTFDHPQDEPEEQQQTEQHPAHTPQPPPSTPAPIALRSLSPISPHPILKSPTFNRAQYIIVSDTDPASEIEDEVLLQLELDASQAEERAVRRTPRLAKRRTMLKWSRK